MEFYEHNGQIGILVSPGFGAGWSTWNSKELAYDKRVVEFWLAHQDDEGFMSTVGHQGSDANLEAKAFFSSIGYEHVYFGGFRDIELRFVNRGVPWRITEYDGSEALETIYDADFTTF